MENIYTYKYLVNIIFHFYIIRKLVSKWFWEMKHFFFSKDIYHESKKGWYFQLMSTLHVAPESPEQLLKKILEEVWASADI